ncbi:hypothetical protein CEXT_177391 [Caerostris extrusa]|uniref:Uncharacterized protein n=1 Tax=Caerostris extrusa TaxID=172846 RepID=A0AAV4PB31_CAEEX|nr:hypothetical protein CEXT_177391 [Caerostris extrusa]
MCYKGNRIVTIFSRRERERERNKKESKEEYVFVFQPKCRRLHKRHAWLKKKQSTGRIPEPLRGDRQSEYQFFFCLLSSIGGELWKG